MPRPGADISASLSANPSAAPSVEGGALCLLTVAPKGMAADP